MLRRVLTPPKVGTTGAENLKGCDCRAKKSADNGKGGEPRGEHPEGKKNGEATRERGAWVRMGRQRATRAHASAIHLKKNGGRGKKLGSLFPFPDPQLA